MGFSMRYDRIAAYVTPWVGGPGGWGCHGRLFSFAHRLDQKSLSTKILYDVLKSVYNVHMDAEIEKLIAGVLSPRSEKVPMRVWAQHAGVNIHTLRKRIQRGMSLADAVRSPVEARTEYDPGWMQIKFAKNNPCTDCRNKYHPDAMEFDHVRGTKRFELSKANGYGAASVAAELAKCDLVCANCHRIRTASRRKIK